MSGIKKNDHKEVISNLEKSKVYSSIGDPVIFLEMLIDIEDVEKIRALYRGLDLSNAIDLLASLSLDKKKKFITYIKDIIPPKTLIHADKITKELIIESIGRKSLVILLEKLHIEDIVDFVEELDTENRNLLIKELIIPIRNKVIERFSYREDTAGRIMKKNFILIDHQLSVNQAITILKRKKKTLSNAYNNYTIAIIDDHHKFMGNILPHQLFNAEIGQLVKDLKLKTQYIFLKEKISEAIHFFKEEEATTISVLNEHHHVVGVISVHQAMEYLEDEMKEDMLYLGGAKVNDFLSNIIDSVSRRMPWSITNLMVASVVSVVVGFFAELIQQIVILIVLLPVILSTCGNIATQTMTITMEAIITNKIHKNNTISFLYKEVVTAGVSGFILSMISFALLVSIGKVQIGIMFAVVIILQFMLSAIVGIITPLFLKYLKFDPAIGSSIFVSGISDISAALNFLGFTSVAVSYFGLIIY